MTGKIIIAVGVCVLMTFSETSAQPIAISELSKITGYPIENIRVKNETISANEKAVRKKKPQCLAHFVYSSDDNTFAAVSVAVGKKGTLLTPELDVEARRLIQKAESNPALPVKLQLISFGKLAYGYSGLGLAGGGGSMNRSVISLPDYDRDIQVTVLFGEDALSPLKGAESYQESVITAEGVNAIIEKCLILISGKIILTPSGENTWSPAESITPPPLQNPGQSSHQKVLSPPDYATALRWSVIILIFMIMLGLMWSLFGKRK